MNPDYVRIKGYYDKKWATKEQVAKYVVYKKITPEEYQLITGDIYPV